MCTEQNVTVGVPESEGRRSKPRTMSSTMPQVPLLVELFPEGKHHRVRLKGIFVEQDSKVRVTSMRTKLIGDVRNMICGFLKNNRMEPSTGRRNYIGGVACAPGLGSTEEQRDGTDDA